MEGPPLGPGGEDITWPDQVAPRGRKASSTRKIKPQTSNPMVYLHAGLEIGSAFPYAIHWASNEDSNVLGSQGSPWSLAW